MRPHRLLKKRPHAAIANTAPTAKPMGVERFSGSKRRQAEKATDKPTAAQRQASTRRELVRNVLGPLDITIMLPKPGATRRVRQKARNPQAASLRCLLRALCACA